MQERMTRYWRLLVRLFDAHSPQEREKRAACLFALLLVAALATLKYVTGVTVHYAPFTLYAVAVAISAARGGIAPAVVATLASALLGGLGARPAPGAEARLLFTAEGLLIGFAVSTLRTRLQGRAAQLRTLEETSAARLRALEASAAARLRTLEATSAAQLRTVEATVADLRLRDRHGRLLDAALRHLEDTAGEAAVVVLDENGTIAEWRPSASRLYGYPATQVVGASARVLFVDAPSATELSALLRRSLDAGSLRRPDVHQRQDGSRVDVELEIRPVCDGDAGGFTLTVHDLARQRAWDDSRQAAAQAQATLQQEVDEAHDRLAALESLTDPSLNPLGGSEMVAELLERLRATTRADGVAFLQSRRAVSGVVATRGLQPAGRSKGGESVRLTPGRVEFVHNDPARVEQLSAFRWPGPVASLLAVPVVHDGQVWSTVEVVSERSRQVSDWDVALARVVADRLAPVAALDQRASRATA